MGDPEGWPQPSGLLPEGSSSSSYAALFSSLEDERWLQAEDRTVELITRIQPTQSSEERRRAVADYVQRLIRRCFTCEVFTFGSVPLKTYLPDGDIDLTAFSRHPHLKETWANEVRAVLEDEERSKRAEFRVKEVQYIQAEVKIIKCLVENIVVDISFNQLGGLCTLCFLEEVDRLIGQDHLFKRSIILVKAWCYYESRILGAHHGLISTYALETLVLYIFHVFHASLRGPLGVLFRFLEFFSNFDWDKYCVSLWGPVPLSALPDMLAEPPRRDGGKLLLSKAFLDACAHAYAVFPGANDVQVRAFSSKYLNVIDPLRTSNNLGRSVSKGNFFRIRSAFSYGARKLARILECPKENVVDELDKFFLNTWDRHGSGRRPDAPEPIERLQPEERAMVEDVETNGGTNVGREEENIVDTDNFDQFDKKALAAQSRAPTLAGEHLKLSSDSGAEDSRSQHSDELARSFSRSASDPSQHHQNRSRSLGLEMHTAEVGLVSNHVGSRKSFLEMGLSERRGSYNESVPSPGLGEKRRVSGDGSVDEADDLTAVKLAASTKSLEKLSLSSTDLSMKIPPPSLWGNASPLDVPAFYPRARPVQMNHSEDVVDVGTEDVPATSHRDSTSHVASSYRHTNVSVPHHLPVHGAVSPTVAGPPPPPLGIHSASASNESSRPPGFGSQSGTYLSMPLLRGPVPPPLPPYGPSGLALPQRVLETGSVEGQQSVQHTDENWQERVQLKDAEDFSEHNRSFKFQVPAPGHTNPTRNGSKELSPEATVFYEQNGVPMEDEEVGNSWHGGEQLKDKGTFQSARAKGYKEFSERGLGKHKAGDELLDARRVGDGAVEPWPVVDPALFHYSQMFSQGAASNPVIYPGLIPSVSLSDSTAPVSSSTSSDASSPVPYPLPPSQRPAVTSQSQTQPSVGVPVGFLRPTSTSSDTAGTTGVHSRKQRPIDNQTAPSFYYSASIPFTYVPVYNSFPVYVLPPEGSYPVAGAADSFNEITGLEEDSQGVPQLICGVGERLSAAGIPVRAGARLNSDRFPGGSVGRFDLLSSDFAIHLRNLDYGRTCLVPSFIPQPIFPPFAKELQGHHIWEGPGRPVQANMNPLKQVGHGPGSSRLPRGYHRAFPGPPGFHGEEVSKPRAGTGTYLPGARHGHRDRQFRSQHDGYQEHSDYTEREGVVPPRYQRGMNRGQNSRMTQNSGTSGTGGGKAGDKGWHDSYNRNSMHALPVAFSSGHPSVPAGSVLTPAQAGMNLDVYSQAYMNGNGNSPTGPLVVVYPYGNANEALEFGSLGPMQLGGSDASRGSLRSQMQATTPYAGNDRQQQPSSPKNQQRPTQLTYQLKEEDFPPLSFRGQGGSTSTASSNTGTRSSPYQTYVASQS